jgi:hypothetical protein
MDKTTTMIRWQRLTIAALLLAVLALGYTCFRERQQANEARRMLRSITRNHLLQSAQRDADEARREGERIRDWYIPTDDLHAFTSVEVVTDAGPFGPGAFQRRVAQSMSGNRQ